jgi:hypothetical protein
VPCLFARSGHRDARGPGTIEAWCAQGGGEIQGRAPSRIAIALTRCTPFGQAEPETNAPPAVTEAGAPDAGAEAEGDATSPCGDTECPPACPAGVCRSCREIHEARPELGSGLYTIEGSAGPMDVHCDMETAGGGWTLVGRSVVDGTSQTFGWRARTGEPSDDTRPYSLDVSRLKVEFTEILFGARVNGKAWGQSVYLATVPRTFATEQASTAVQISPSRLIGTCAGGVMHRWIGHTERTTVFFFRDKPEADTLFGLEPNGWDTNGTAGEPCKYASDLSQQQGMIFVR